MNRTSKSFGQKRLSHSSTPLSITSKRFIKQQPNIEDIYFQMKQKINQMQSAFKSEHLSRERQMLQTYIKILDKIGIQVMMAKEKYLNLNKQNLKTDKRLQIVTQLKKQRQNCSFFTKNIQDVREQIKRYEDENNYLEKEVEALENITKRKLSLQKLEHQKYRTSKKKAKSLQKHLEDLTHQNDKFVLGPKRSLELAKTFDVKNRVKSFMVENEAPQVSIDTSTLQFKTDSRPHTQQKYIGNKRIKNKYFNLPLQQNMQISHFT